MCILVVDDIEEGREVFEAVLAEGGYEDVVAVDSASAAFSFLGIDSPDAVVPAPVDLVLLDVIMPGTDGIQACARIRRDPRYADVPIVMTTSLDDIESVDQAFQSGATDYITKPLKAVDLLAKVRSALRLKADLERRNERERKLLQQVPFSFSQLAPT